ncbi:MAG: site-specific integrase [Dehalococcoidia bacterium]|nr:site-specific integrase [Dehalococcoidia bacterium]
MPRKPPIPNQEPVEYLTPAHVAAMEAAAPNMREELLIRLLFRSGCRISEALALRPVDISASRKIITIQHLKQRVLLKCPDCGERLARRDRVCSQCAQPVTEAMRQVQEQRSRRVIQIDQGSIDLVELYVRTDPRFRKNREARLFLFGTRWAEKLVAEMARAAGVPPVINEMGKVHKVSPHRLRDAHATHFITEMKKLGEEDDAYRLLQLQLGHASVATTFKYRKLANVEQRKAYNQVFGEQEGVKEGNPP